jgi:hypothetical protein
VARVAANRYTVRTGQRKAFGDDVEPTTDIDNKRTHKRVLGPFVGRRGTLLAVPIRIHDLSIGGALIECFHEERLGRRITVEIELPIEGWVTVDAEIVSIRQNYGYAVKWVNVTPDVQWKLELTIDRICAEAHAG